MVVFENGVAKGSEYRRFRIRTIEGPNDFAMMHEAIRRRFQRGLEERQNLQTEQSKFAKFLDLLLIDGGKGQLSAVGAALDELGLGHLPRIGLAKQEEEIYQPDQEAPIRLARRSEALKLLQRVRDESHRFAVTFHRKRRQMRDRKSELLEIPGVGERTRQRLLQHFGSVRAVQQADAAALGAVLTKSQTEAVLRHFQKEVS